MENQKHDTPDSTGEEHGTEAPVMETVARGIGTAMGVVASTAAKVMGKSDPAPGEPKTAKTPEAKTKDKPRKAPRQRASSDEGSSKHAASRLAKKKKKRAAHRVKLKRSNTKG